MAKRDCKYFIPIKTWSYTDYQYLEQNKLGFLSDDTTMYLFSNLAKMSKFKSYLKSKNARK